MVETRWLRWIGPGLIVLGGFGAVAATTSGATATRSWAAAPCAGTPAASGAQADAADPRLAPAGSSPWFRLDPILDEGGALQGQRLELRSPSSSTIRTIELPAESFAAGPFGQTVLVGSDDGSTSTVDLVDVDRACHWSLDDSAAVVRRATLDRSRSGIIEMRVDRTTREDLGIWFRPFGRSGPPRRILDPLEPDARFGRTWSTEFTWDRADDRLAIQSCGESSCRARILAPDTGAVAMVDEPGLGPLVGLAGERIVTYAACRGLPCPVIATDVRSGAREILATAAGGAILGGPAGDQHLIYEFESPGGRTLRSVGLSGGRTIDLGPVPDGMSIGVPPGRPGELDPALVGRLRLALDEVSR